MVADFSSHNPFSLQQLEPCKPVPLPTHQTPHDCLTLTQQLLILKADLQETIITIAEIA